MTQKSQSQSNHRIQINYNALKSSRMSFFTRSKGITWKQQSKQKQIYFLPVFYPPKDVIKKFHINYIYRISDDVCFPKVDTSACPFFVKLDWLWHKLA